MRLKQCIVVQVVVDILLGGRLQRGQVERSAVGVDNIVVIVIPRLLLNCLYNLLKFLRQLGITATLFFFLPPLHTQESFHTTLQLPLRMAVPDELRRQPNAHLLARIALLQLPLLFLLLRGLPSVLSFAEACGAHIEFVAALELLQLALGDARAILLVLFLDLAGRLRDAEGIRRHVGPRMVVVTGGVGVLVLVVRRAKMRWGRLARATLDTPSRASPSTNVAPRAVASQVPRSMAFALKGVAYVTGAASGE
jgi:hypothetical protein